MISFKPDRNNGDSNRLNALYRIYPWLREIIGDREVSIICVGNAIEMASYTFDESAMGFNVGGKVILRASGKVVTEVSFVEIHKHRSELGLRPILLNSPQSEIAGDETECIILHDHAEDHDTPFNGIHLEVFISPQHFNLIPEIAAWLAEGNVRSQLIEAGIPV